MPPSNLGHFNPGKRTTDVQWTGNSVGQSSYGCNNKKGNPYRGW